MPPVLIRLAGACESRKCVGRCGKIEAWRRPKDEKRFGIGNQKGEYGIAHSVWNTSVREALRGCHVRVCCWHSAY
ncbi:hypothetical protein HaLaN_31451, partial [Haematococcus lacustris]